MYSFVRQGRVQWAAYLPNPSGRAENIVDDPRPRHYRHKECCKRFTATTNTCMHATKRQGDGEAKEMAPALRPASLVENFKGGGLRPLSPRVLAKSAIENTPVRGDHLVERFLGVGNQFRALGMSVRR